MLNPSQRFRLRRAADCWPAVRPLLQPSQHHWFGPQRQQAMQALVVRHSPGGVFLETGCWTGAGSTCFLLRQFPGLTVIAVDRFKGHPIAASQPDAPQLGEVLWEHFCSNVWEDRERVFPFRLSLIGGMQAVARLGIRPEFVYLNASYDEETVYSEIASAAMLFPAAVLMGDEYASIQRPGVRQAVNRAVSQRVLRAGDIRVTDPLWYSVRNLT